MLLVIMNLFKKKQKQEHVLSVDLLYTHTSLYDVETLWLIVVCY